MRVLYLNSRVVLVMGIALLLIAFAAVPAQAGAKVGIYGVYLEPYGMDAEQYSEGAVGWGVQAVLPSSRPIHMFAMVLGFENVFLQAHTEDIREPRTGFLIQQRTRQRYTRFYLGAELGGHGRAFFRPHVGANIAAVNYGFSIDLIIPNDLSDEPLLQQNVWEEDHWVFGQDLNAGLDLRFSEWLSTDVGVRYLKSWAVPQDLGKDAVTVHPEYFQIYAGICTSF